MDAALEASTMRKVYIRLLPFAILSYVLAYVDRINVSFAALTMRDDLHMSAGDFGFAVGTFYWAYFLFEVPSNVIMEKVGARHVDRPHHDHLGHLRRRHRLRHRHDELRHRALPARHGRSGLLSRPHPLFHLLVPRPAPCAYRLQLPGRPADRGGVRCADLDGADEPGRHVRPARLADHVPRRGHPDGDHRHRHLLRPDRQARTGQVPDAAGTRLAGREDRRRAQGQGGGADLFAVRIDDQSQGAAAGAQLYRHRHGEPRHADLHPADHQVDRPVRQHDGRLADHDPLYLRRHLAGGVGPHLRPHERAALEPADRLHPVDRRAGDGRPDHGHLVVAGRHVAGGDGLLRLEGPVLRHAADVPERHGAGRRLRLDQLDRQSRRLLRAVVGRRHEGPDRQLRRRPLWAGAASLVSAMVCALFLHIPDVVTPASARPAMAPAR